VFWRFEHARLAKLVTAMAVAIGVGLLWFVPMIRRSGGLQTYVAIGRLHAAFNAPATLWGGGWKALSVNVANMVGFCWNGLVLGAVVLLLAHLYRTFKMDYQQKARWQAEHSLELTVLGFGWFR